LISGIDTIEVTNIPMMITLTFSGAVNGENINVYNKIFHRLDAISKMQGVAHGFPQKKSVNLVQPFCQLWLA